MKSSLFRTIFLLYNGILFAQGGASAHSDAIHAFDEPNASSGGSWGVGGYILMLLIFLFALFLWGNSMEDKK